MTLNIGVCIPQMRPYQRSLDAPLRPQGRLHGCRHPPPPARPNQFIRWNSERVDGGVVTTRPSGLSKTGSVGLHVTPARKTPVNPGVQPACGA